MCDGSCDNYIRQYPHEAIPLRKRHEYVRIEQSELGMGPACKRFYTDNGARFQADFRLVVKIDVSALKRVRQFIGSYVYGCGLRLLRWRRQAREERSQLGVFGGLG